MTKSVFLTSPLVVLRVCGLHLHKLCFALKDCLTRELPAGSGQREPSAGGNRGEDAALARAPSAEQPAGPTGKCVAGRAYRVADKFTSQGFVCKPMKP